MAGYSKDQERQNKALKDLISGKEHEKSYIQVGYEGKKDEGQGGKTRESELSKVMQKVRMPWFCPECKKTMKKKLDDKFWRMFGHCFDCQIEIENKLKINGEYKQYEQRKVLENKKAYLKDLRDSIEEFEKGGGKQTWLNQVGVDAPEVEEEKWEMGKDNFDKMVVEANEYIDNLQKNLDEQEKQLIGA